MYNGRMGAYERGQAAWPTVQLDPAVFAAHLAKLEANDEHAEDLYLTCACGEGNTSALELFDARFLAQVPRLIARADSSPAVAEEVKQMLRAELLVAPPDGKPRIASYAGRGSLVGWLRVAAVRQVHRLKRRKIDRVPGEDALVAKLVAVEPNAEVALIRARHGAELATALRGAMATLPARERALLKLHVLDGLTIDDLCGFYEVHRATVARWIVKLKQQLFDEATRHLKQRLAMNTSEVESLCRALGSQIDLSLAGLLHADD
jgi:RNA polymerase sigma-70 factor (ECF subfamily)